MLLAFQTDSLIPSQQDLCDISLKELELDKCDNMGNFSLNDDSIQFLASGSGLEEYSPNLSCAALSFEADTNNQTDLPAAVEIAVRVFQTLFGLSLVIVGVILNSLIIYLIFKFKKLRTVTYGIIFQIAIINLVMSISFGFPTIINYIAGYWILGVHICITTGALFQILCTIRTFLFFVFSFNHFFMVFTPFRYPKHCLKVVGFHSFIVWFSCITFNLVLSFLDCFVYISETKFCAADTSCHQTCRIVFYIFYDALFAKGTKILDYPQKF